ncbi:MAG: hypothetical protein JW891_07260 [Candidatus Lokiarchaeota archaeon]|nr:hypothetical protein [Candidatus Lokiarchaeota archaeon]
MRKGLLTAFILSMLVFVLLNFLFWIIGYAIVGTLDSQIDYISTEPRIILVRLVYPIAGYPWEIIEGAANTTFDGIRVMLIGYFLSLIISSIVAGLAAGDLGNAFFAWALVCVVSVILALIGFDLFTSDLQSEAYDIIFAGIIHLILFGLLALLVAQIARRPEK